MDDLTASSEFRSFQVSWGLFVHAKKRSFIPTATGSEVSRELDDQEFEILDAPKSSGKMAKLLSPPLTRTRLNGIKMFHLRFGHLSVEKMALLMERAGLEPSNLSPQI